MIIDEHGGSREVLRWLLRLRGFTCLVAANVEAALETIAKLESTVIVVASHLTSENGCKLAASRDHQARRFVIAVVDNPAQVIDHELVDVVLTRPIRVSALDAALEIAGGDLG